MNRRTTCLATILLGLMTCQASAQTLSIGDKAPPLTLGRFVKGEKIDRLEPETTYVVEFWATWHAPGLKMIPILTDLQKKYRDKGVKVLGVAGFEQDQSQVDRFVTKMGEKMDYSVALDDCPEGSKGGDGKMTTAWLMASETFSVPVAFIVQKGKVAWIGHPDALEEALGKVVDGTYDLPAAIAKAREEKAEKQKVIGVITKIQNLGPEGTPEQRIAILDAAFAELPGVERSLGFPKYSMMLQADIKGAAAYGAHLVEKTLFDDPVTLNNLAWLHVAPEAKDAGFKLDPALALKAATRAVELSKGQNSAFLDTLAKAYFDLDNPTKALAIQEKAVKIGGESEDEMKGRLDQYRKAVEANKKP